MVLIETIAGVMTAGLLGVAAGSVASALSISAPAPEFAAAVVAGAVALDVGGLRWPPLRPPAVRRQVPEAWGRLFGAPVAALLYGARLGIGPATILVTWLWWAGLVLGAAGGPWVAAGVLVSFHVSRVLTQELAMAGAGDRPRRMVALEARRRPVALALGVVVVGASAWLALDRGVTERSTSADVGRPASTPDARTISPEERPVATDTELDSLLLDDTLAGFARDSSLGAGSLDLDAAAALEPDATAERALLETRGFRHGESRAFSNGDGDVVWIQVYELADEQQARLYLEDGWETILARGGQPFDAEGIAGARGMTIVDETPDGAFVGHAVSFTSGARHVLVIAGSPRGALRADDAIAVATRQAERLGLATTTPAPGPPPDSPPES